MNGRKAISPTSESASVNGRVLVNGSKGWSLSRCSCNRASSGRDAWMMACALGVGVIPEGTRMKSGSSIVSRPPERHADRGLAHAQHARRPADAQLVIEREGDRQEVEVGVFTAVEASRQPMTPVKFADRVDNSQSAFKLGML